MGGAGVETNLEPDRLDDLRKCANRMRNGWGDAEINTKYGVTICTNCKNCTRSKYIIGVAISKGLLASTQVQQNGGSGNLVMALGVAKNQYPLYDVRRGRKEQG